MPSKQGAGCAPASFILASQLLVKLGATRPPIKRISITMRPSAARVEKFRKAKTRVFEVKGDIVERERQNKSDHLEIAPVAAIHHLAADKAGEDREERDVDKRAAGMRPVSAEKEDGEPACRPQGGQCSQRRADNRQAASPVRGRRQEKSRDDRADIAEDHFMRVPINGRKGRRNLDPAFEEWRPDRHADHRPRARNEKERTEAAAQHRRSAPEPSRSGGTDVRRR